MKNLYGGFLVLFLLAGCGQPDIGGKYYGRLAITEDGKLSVHRVEADVEGTALQLAFNLKGRDNNYNFGDVSVRVEPVRKSLTIQSTLSIVRPQIRLAAAGACASTSSTSPFDAEICIAGNVITLQYREGSKQVSLQAYRTKPEDETEIPPGPKTIAELTEIAKEQNLDILLKAQDVYRAREEVLLRRGNMYPNFNLGTILAAIDLPFGLLSQIGNLMPFLFPDNWYRLAASKELKNAQEHSYKSLKANQVHIVVGISYLLLKDQALKSSIQGHVADLNEVYDRTKMLVANGQAPSSWEQIVQMKLLEDEEDLVVYEQYLAQQMIGLEKLLGAKPTQAGITIVPETLPDINETLIQDLTEEEIQAFDRAPEMKATIHLEKAAEKMVQAVTWAWLNPNCDPRFNMGLGLEHAIKIEKSNIENIKLKRKEVDLTIRGNTLDIENGVKFLVEQYELASKGETAAREGLKIALKQFENAQLSLLDTLEFAEKLFKYRAKKMAARFTYLIVRDKLDRHTLSGFYEKLPLPPEPKEDGGGV